MRARRLRSEETFDFVLAADGDDVDDVRSEDEEEVGRCRDASVH